MSEILPTIKSPELVFGVAGPIGVDMDAIVAALSDALTAVRYRPVPVRLTETMQAFHADIDLPQTNFFEESKFKMAYGNAICRDAGDRARLARIAVLAIRSCRAAATGNADIAADATAYIVRQLKRPDEVELLRRVYGRQFVLVSAYGSLDQRRAALQEALRRSLSTRASPGELSAHADQLIEDDAAEEADPFGQKLRDTFHRGDVFIDGLSRLAMTDKLTRFVQALFGRVDIAPAKDEHGMYAASSAALRSTDLSRQVGAAIVSPDGEVITLGCNEVPKAFGGSYWDGEEPDFRDVKLGYDPNTLEIREVLRDLFQRLQDADLLSDRARAIGPPERIVEQLTAGPLADAAVLDLTEYGRVVHAEMNAICDAARLGRSVRGATLYCTTFPCHNCTKHILAAGIRRVVYIEPYPKSRAKALHANEIEVENDNPARVVFAPFLGIAPHRYRDIFQKSRRKHPDGRARRWYHDEERPLVEVIYPAYLAAEVFALHPLLGHVEPHGAAP